MAWSLRMLQAAFSDRRWEIHQVIAEDDTVVLYCTFHGRHTGQFMGLAPTSRSFASAKSTSSAFRTAWASSIGPSRAPLARAVRVRRVPSEAQDTERDGSPRRPMFPMIIRVGWR